MNKQDATQRLIENPVNPIYFVEKDATGAWFDWSVVWLVQGELVMAHPTEINHTISAPEGDHYQHAPEPEAA